MYNSFSPKNPDDDSLRQFSFRQRTGIMGPFCLFEIRSLVMLG